MKEKKRDMEVERRVFKFFGKESVRAGAVLCGPKRSRPIFIPFHFWVRDSTNCALHATSCRFHWF